MPLSAIGTASVFVLLAECVCCVCVESKLCVCASVVLIYATHSHMPPYLVCVFKPLNGCHRH